MGSSDIDNYLQLFIYRVPKENHDAMLQLQDKLVSKWKGAGILGSEFFQLTKAELVKGFTGLGEMVSVRPDEDLWIELQRYRDREHRDKIFKHHTKRLWLAAIVRTVLRTSKPGTERRHGATSK